MFLLILLLASVLALGVWAFWPRRRGVVDNDVLRSKWTADGKGTYFGGH